MSGALPQVVLVRHGETAWTISRQHTGRTDLPLNGQGERQAREVGVRLTALRFDRILSSPLQRARRTAELAMPHSWVEADDDLICTEWPRHHHCGRDMNGQERRMIEPQTTLDVALPPHAIDAVVFESYGSRQTGRKHE